MANKRNLSQLTAQAEELAMEASERKCPILLKQVAARRRVSEVVFGQLLVDALLTSHPSGFRIFFRCERDEASNFYETYKNESAEKLLPSRVRFSLAHEIAHTLFYDLSQAHPKVKTPALETELDNLENICNRLAAHLLMPLELLKIETVKLPDLKPGAVLSMAAKFGVSPETLVVQLGTNSNLLAMKHNLRGCIVVLMDTLNGFMVKAFARQKHIVIPSQLAFIKRGELLKDGGIDWNAIFAGKENGQTVLPLTLKFEMASEQKNYILDFIRYGSPSKGDLFLVTVDLAE